MSTVGVLFQLHIGALARIGALDTGYGSKGTISISYT